MPKIGLTDLSVRSLKEGLYFDTKTPAFGIRVGKNRKTWLVVKGDNRTKVRLGHYPDLSLHDARRRALVALGTPLATKTTLTFPEALELFLGQDKWKARSKYVLEHSLRWHFKWTRPLHKITYEDIAEVLDAIKGRSARAHALKDIRTFFNWCVPRYLSQSPASGLKMPPYIPRERVLTDDEIARVWNAAETLGTYGKQVQCLILSGQRVNQILSLEPQWINAREQVITFPASVMKANREHTIVYGPMLAKLLPQIAIRSMQGKKKRELDTLSGVTGWVLHDLRRVLASQWAALGVSLPTIEVYLGHRSHSFAGIVAVYQKHTWIPEMRQAVSLWEKKLQSLARSGYPAASRSP